MSTGKAPSKRFDRVLIMLQKQPPQMFFKIAVLKKFANHRKTPVLESDYNFIEKETLARTLFYRPYLDDCFYQYSCFREKFAKVL